MNYVKFCPICASITYYSDDINVSSEKDLIFYNNNRCCECGGILLETNITTTEYYSNVILKLNTQAANLEILNNYIRPLGQIEHTSKVYLDNMLKYYNINLYGDINEKVAPKCPTCNSHDIRKISSFERFLNACLFGLLGNKRKCHFECQNPNCKYKW